MLEIDSSDFLSVLIALDNFGAGFTVGVGEDSSTGVGELSPSVFATVGAFFRLDRLLSPIPAEVSYEVKFSLDFFSAGAGLREADEDDMSVADKS